MSFDSIDGLVDYTERKRKLSRVHTATVEHLHIFTEGNSMSPGRDPLILRGNNAEAALNNHAFNQLCSVIGARAGEYRKLPSAIAQVPLSYLASRSDRKDVKLLIGYHPQGSEIPTCRAINSASYGRIWNHELAKAVEDNIDPEIWKVPVATGFHLHQGFITANDRKAFVFLVNEGNPIELPNSHAPLFRGFYAWNSEVGDGTCGIAEFLYNQACANRAIMGLTNYQELKIRHTSGAPQRWVQDAVPSLTEYVNKDTSDIVKLLQKSKETTVAKDDKGALAWLQNRGFTKSLAKASLESAREDARGADSNYSPFSVWNLIQGITAEARAKENNDDRVAIEMAAGKLMKAVA
jgi:hypothetical protein